MIVEWSHRWLAAIVGTLAVLTAISAWRHHRKERLIPSVATAAVAVLAVQAWIGRAVVQQHLDADLVTLHLSISLIAAALLTTTVVATGLNKAAARQHATSWLVSIAAAAAPVLTVIMLGSLVHNMFFPGWPLMSGGLLPELGSHAAIVHYAHRLTAGLYTFAAVALWATARRKQRPRHEVTVLGVAALLYTANIAVGAAHVATRVESSVLVSLHLGLASTVWVLTVAAAVSAARLGQTLPERIDHPI